MKYVAAYLLVRAHSRDAMRCDAGQRIPMRWCGVRTCDDVHAREGM
jgi:hypothetical protein